jgi:hypothetical protein
VEGAVAIVATLGLVVLGSIFLFFTSVLFAVVALGLGFAQGIPEILFFVLLRLGEKLFLEEYL